MITPRIALLMTGNELIHGDIIDTNASFIAQALKAINACVTKKVTLGDDLLSLTAEIQRLSQEFDLVIINGGLGPTQDDLTAQALSKACNQPLHTHPDAKHHIINWCQKRGAKITDKQLKQAELPENARLFDDAPGSAAAFYLKHNDALLIATPGVPSELKHIVQHQLIDFIQQRFLLSETTAWSTQNLFGVSESFIERLIEQSSIFPLVNIGFRVNTPYLEFKYQLKTGLSDSDINNVHATLQPLIAPFFVGNNQTTMSQAVSQLLREKDQRLSTAESCTGGLIAQMMTQDAGASTVFEGAAVTYSNHLKEEMLQVPAEMLAQCGAVSEETAQAMLQGLLRLTKTAYGLAVTGIAGPEGGTDDKPVGTVFIAFGSQDKHQVVRLVIPMQRLYFQRFVATCALDLIRHFIRGDDLPRYLNRWQVTEK